MTFSIAEQIKEAVRELHVRKSVYPRQVSSAKMKQADADRRIALQQAIIDSLQSLAKDEALI